MNEKSIKDFEGLEVWQEANKFVLEIYKITKNFPKEETFGIVSQLRRAAISITSNIAEGFGRFHYKDKIRFYYQARGSTMEVQNLLIVCENLSYLDNQIAQKFKIQLITILKLLNGLVRSVKT